MIFAPQRSGLSGRRLPAFFTLHDVTPAGHVIGNYRGHDIHRNIIDTWSRRCSFIGVAPAGPQDGYDFEVLQSGEFILPPGLIYRLDRKPRTWRDRLCRRNK